MDQPDDPERVPMQGHDTPEVQDQRLDPSAVAAAAALSAKAKEIAAMLQASLSQSAGAYPAGWPQVQDAHALRWPFQNR